MIGGGEIFSVYCARNRFSFVRLSCRLSGRGVAGRSIPFQVLRATKAALLFRSIMKTSLRLLAYIRQLLRNKLSSPPKMYYDGACQLLRPGAGFCGMSGY